MATVCPHPRPSPSPSRSRARRATRLPPAILLLWPLILAATPSCLAAPAPTPTPTSTPTAATFSAPATAITLLDVSTPAPTPSWVPAQRQVRISLPSSPSTTFGFPFAPTRTPIPDTSDQGMDLSTRLIGLIILFLFVSLILCAMRMSTASIPPSESVHPSARRHARRRPRRPGHPHDPDDSPNTDPPHPAHLASFGNPLAAPVYRYNFSSRGVPLFQRDYPPTAFPIDAHLLAAMQESPDQWHFLEPSRILPEFRLLLFPFVACDIDAQLVKLFHQGGGAAPKHESRSRPRAVCVQTRLPVPVPPEDARDVDSPYAGFRVPSIVYFEVRITRLAAGTPGSRARSAPAAESASPTNGAAQVAIGVAYGPYPPFRLPGWSPWSAAYESHKGFLYTGSSASGQAYGPTFGAGDVVGVGVETTSRCVFFTLNGKRLQMAVELPPGKEAVYPTVGATGACEFEYNFGNKCEYVWDGRMFESDEVFRAGVDGDGWEMVGVRSGDAGGYRAGEFVGYVMDVLPAYEE